MERTTLIAAVLAPLALPVYRYLFLKPGQVAHDWLWKRLPDGRLRRILLRKV